MLTPIDLIITLTPFQTRTVSFGLWSYSARQTGGNDEVVFISYCHRFVVDPFGGDNESDFRESRKQRVQAILSKHGATNCYRSWIGDKTCDQACNNKNYGFDGGDCLPRFQQMHSTLRTEAFQSSFDVQVKGYTTTETTRLEHHVYDVPYTTVRRLQTFTLEPVGNSGSADIVEMRIFTRYEKCVLKVEETRREFGCGSNPSKRCRWYQRRGFRH